ncbi:uncharacterized protein Z519_09269 [Cladophialophora bantiana CBS 173.52]|uniref:Forkhead box protein O n=1 Tax=Cladophialophora bantiana (strain ATCC 10958 / CBS 173.52 / CDC B-1940 / NIH 8579) TaxID=1442370 RepID=A0A0D2HGA9_CLAB1|nr:uncharacterized protein Z519_09269 [Cladophialophora bantiana CBS 173.52]KIW89840.1 hypothetical protein Z519_09269 [Cladophialophora bantiana CBS 173.52]
MRRTVEMDAEIPTHRYEAYDNFGDFELSNITTGAFEEQNLQSPSAISHLQMHHGQQHTDVHPLLQVETVDDIPYENFHPHHEHIFPASAQLQFSEIDLDPTWAPHPYPQFISNTVGQTDGFSGLPLFPYTADPVDPPLSAYQYYEEQNIWPSSDEYSQCRIFTTMEEDEDAVDDKPYARLIYEALMQAPGHRLMLREIYEWFRHNTTKPQESGSNGWQNSIRHNLSMNKAFENDRDSAKGSVRKATSVWMLTDEAIKNGVQSTTRYRKSGAGKKTLRGRIPAIQRQRAGAKGGRAARHSAKRRYQEQGAFTDSTPTASPSTTSYSDYTDYQSFDSLDLRLAAKSWPMTPVEQNLAAEEANLLSCLSPQSAPGFRPQRIGYGEENAHLQDALLQSMQDQ